MPHEATRAPFVREFWQDTREVPSSFGKVIVRADTYGESFALIESLRDALTEDMATAKPPIPCENERIKVVKYGGSRISGTWGVELDIPEGHTLPEAYEAVSGMEMTR